jgi:hypothetical protein
LCLVPGSACCCGIFFVITIALISFFTPETSNLQDNMKEATVLLLVSLVATGTSFHNNCVLAFTPHTSGRNRNHLAFQTTTSTTLSKLLLSSQDKVGEGQKESTLSPSESQVYSLLKKLSDSGLEFRIVVVGNGAILETTNLLGPTMKLGQSPASGANLVTFASDDSSFEFHLMIEQISQVAMVEKESPVLSGRIMQIMRFLNEDGKSICSLILADDSRDAAAWYQGILSEYGSEWKVPLN